jgi:hypothetical protein
MMKPSPKVTVPFSFIAGVVLALFSAKVSALLPTGVTLKPFYNTAQVSFVRDTIRTVGMWEVPGKTQHFFVLDQMGAVYSLYPDTTKTYAPDAIKDYTKGTIANFRDKVKHNLRSEMGAWSLAFHPKFAQNHYFYVMYFGYPVPKVATSDNWRTDGNVNVERWVVGADYKTATRDTTIYSFYHPASYGVSSMAFGLDGYLYMGTSVYSADGWDSTTVARKVLRIDVDRRDAGKMYAIPLTNPFYNSTVANIKKEIYALGLRNAWSMAFDFQTEKLWVGDVGQTLYEEINIIQPKKNYGWAEGGNSESSANGHGVQGPCPSGFSYNGTTCANLADPDWYFPHVDDGKGAINCIVVGPAFHGDPASPYYGYHFITDVQRNQFWVLKEGTTPQVVGESPKTNTTNVNDHNGIVHIGEDSYGNLYASAVSWFFNGSIGTGDNSTNPLPAGESMYHEILRLSHAQLTPRAIPTSIAGEGLRFQNNKNLRLVHGKGREAVAIPIEYSRVSLFNLTGKQVWSYRGKEKEVTIPSEVEQGILQLRFQP